MTQQRASDIANDAKDKAAEVAATVKDKASELSSQAGEVVSNVKDKAADVGSQAVAKADGALDATGQGLTTMAQTLREKAPSEGKVADVAASAADALERGGNYLQDANLSDMRGDVERIIRQYPLQSLLVGVGIGYLIARATR